MRSISRNTAKLFLVFFAVNGHAVDLILCCRRMTWINLSSFAIFFFLGWSFDISEPFNHERAHSCFTFCICLSDVPKNIRWLHEFVELGGKWLQSAKIHFGVDILHFDSNIPELRFNMWVWSLFKSASRNPWRFEMWLGKQNRATFFFFCALPFVLWLVVKKSKFPPNTCGSFSVRLIKNVQLGLISPSRVHEGLGRPSSHPTCAYIPAH